MIEKVQETVFGRGCSQKSPSTTEGPASMQVYDFAHLVKQFNGSNEFAIYITEKFVASLSEYREALDHSVRDFDFEQVWQVAHKLNGAAASLSIGRVSGVAEQIESAASDAQIESIHLLLREIDKEIGAFLNAFQTQKALNTASRNKTDIDVN